jgi:glutathione S-transferase
VKAGRQTAKVDVRREQRRQALEILAAEAEQEILGELPSMLDRIDAWIADGVLGAVDLNVADFMIAPSLALILYRQDLLPMFEGRPALELVERILPKP